MLSMHTFLPILVMVAAPEDQHTCVVTMLSACAARRHC